jgi:hypothetical protein
MRPWHVQETNNTSSYSSTYLVILTIDVVVPNFSEGTFILFTDSR